MTILSSALGSVTNANPEAAARGITRPDAETSPMRAVGMFFFGVDEAALYAAPQTVLTKVGGFQRAIGADIEADFSFNLAARNREWWNSVKPQTNNTAEQIMYGAGSFVGKTAIGWALRAPVLGTAVMQETQASIESAASGIDATTSAMRGAVSGLSAGASVALPFSLSLLRGSGALSATAQRLGYGVASNVGVGVAERSADYAVLRAAGYSQEAAKVNILDPTALAVDTVLGLAFGGLARVGDIGRIRADVDAKIQSAAEAHQAKPVVESSTNNAVITPEQRALQPIEDARRAADEAMARVNEEAGQRLAVLSEEAKKRPFSRGEKKALESKASDLARHAERFDEQDAGRVDALAKEYKQKGMAAREAKRKAIDNEAKERWIAKADIERQIDGIRQELGVYNRAKAAEAAVSRLQQKIRSAQSASDVAAALDDVKLMEQVQATGWREMEQLLKARQSLTAEQVDAALVKNLEFDAADKIPGKPADGSQMSNHNAAMADAHRSIVDGTELTTDITGTVKTKQDQRLNNRVGDRIKTINDALGDDVEYANACIANPMDDLRDMDIAPKPIDTHVAEMIDNFDNELAALSDDITVTLEDGTRVTGAELKARYDAEIAEINDMNNAVDQRMSCFIEGGPNV